MGWLSGKGFRGHHARTLELEKGKRKEDRRRALEKPADKGKERTHKQSGGVAAASAEFRLSLWLPRS